MDKARYQRLMDLFDDTCDVTLVEQRAVVRRLRQTDPEMADRLAALLEHDAKETDVLAPAAGARALADELAVLSSSFQGDEDDDADSAVRRVGKQVGDWIVDERIGSGGVGTVYRAHHASGGELVAIKFLKRAAVSDPNNVTRLRREFRNVKRLRHPGCLEVYEQGAGEHGHYIVMEWARGGDLRRLTKGPMPVLLHVFREVAEALAYVHGQGIVHRDLKPANVLLTDARPLQPKLADFGIAKVPDATAVITGTGAVMGSIDFLAPELIKGATADERSDMYAFGCMIHTLVTGEPPFGGDNFERLYARLRGEPPALDERAPHVPAELAQLTARLLERDPAARPQDFGVISGALYTP